MLSDVNLKNLVGRLNGTCNESLREAAHLCLSRTHYDVEVEHLLLALLRTDDSDLVPICRQWDLSRADLAADIEKAMRPFKTGNTATPRFSPHLVHWLQSAWMLASIDYGAPAIRSAHLVVSLLTDDEFAYKAKALSPGFQEINVQDLKTLFERLIQNSPEELGLDVDPDAPARVDASGGQDAHGKTGVATPGGQETPALDQYTTDLVSQARSGRIDRIIGRDSEIRQMIDVLLRRRKNNPIVVGEAGVGKTAVVEGLAVRIVQGDVPDPLKNVSIRGLDLGLLQAGAGVRGEFENRLKEVIREVNASATPIILFIDEAHTLMGAGGTEGKGDAANLLKPALARGELRTIAATTHAEYKKHIEKDAALERRFQPIHVGEPDVDTAILMMRAIAGRYEEHHGVRILDEALRAAVELGDRYVSGRNLPDKSVDILDTACARVALCRASTPEAIEAAERRRADLDREIKVLEREQVVGDGDHEATLARLCMSRTKADEELETLRGRYAQAQELVEEVIEIRLALEARALDSDSAESLPERLQQSSDQELRDALSSKTQELGALQGDDQLVMVCVDADVVAQVVSGWTGVPLGRMVRDEISAVQRLQRELEKRVIGQSAALEEIAKRIQISRAGLEDPRKPIGVFLMAGPSGVGKTETALALAEILYGGERNVVTINMSEYQESHSVSNLKGAPKGYVSYGEGGTLTEPVRQRPYCVVLLDEVEKAHQDVMEVFFQVFDKGTLEDSTGRVVNFRNTVILLTSNLGGDEIVRETLAHSGDVPSADRMHELVMAALRGHFPAAFLGRLVVLPFAPLPDHVLRGIAVLKLNKVIGRMQDQHRVALEFDDQVVDSIVDRCVEVESGARNIDKIVTNTILPALGKLVLTWLAEEDLPARVRVVRGKDGEFSYLRNGREAASDADLASSALGHDGGKTEGSI